MSAAVQGDEEFATRGSDVNEIVLIVRRIGRVRGAIPLGRSVGAVQGSRISNDAPGSPLIAGAEDAAGLGTDDDLVAVNRVDGEVRAPQERPLRIGDRAGQILLDQAEAAGGSCAGNVAG